jgi:hypothetical protein
MYVLFITGDREAETMLSAIWDNIVSKDYKISICRFFAKYVTVRSKSEHWLARNKYNMGRSPNYGRNSNILIPDPYH